MKKFTFKKDKPTGRYRSFFPTPTIVKMDGRVVGSINEDRNTPSPSDVFRDVWRIRIVVADSESAAGWRWVTLKKVCASEPEAREWLNENIGLLFDRYAIVPLD